MKKNTLLINNLSVTACSEKKEEKEILKGINLKINSREIHAVMGPNGAGKTTLAMSLMGHPIFKIKNHPSVGGSKIKINAKDITQISPEERVREGLFVSFQQPTEITGVSFLSFLRTAYKTLYPKDKISLLEFKEKVKKAFKNVGLEEDFIQRSINEGFSGGEKKRAEVAQLLVLQPKFAVLDEIDSGLDVDSLKIIANIIKKTVEENNMGVIVITHYNRILDYLKPDLIHVLKNGKIKKSGSLNLVKRIEKEGYGAI